LKRVRKIMFFKMAWRNVWRNKRRSWIIICAVVIGLVGMLFSLAFMEGMMRQTLVNALGTHIAHLEIHRKGFENNKVISLSIENPQEVIKVVAKGRGVVAYSRRVVTSGLISSSESSSGITIVGVDPQEEPRVTTIKGSVIQGDYLEEDGAYQILIGQSLAEKLKVGLGDKIVLMAQDLTGDIGSGAYRVKGIFKTASPEFDKYMVYLDLKDSQKLLSLGDRISEVAILIATPGNPESVQKALLIDLGTKKYEVLTWKQIIPILVSEIEFFNEFIYIFFLVICVAMGFGIVNTLLMAIMERIHEFGIMMALGVRPRKIFQLVVAESVLLCLCGLVVGNLFSYLLVLYVSKKGFNLAVFSKSLETFGIGHFIYPHLTVFMVLIGAVTVLVMGILASLYPGYKASRLQPVEALRYV
jgi:putative ABC transport system permease protein